MDKGNVLVFNEPGEKMLLVNKDLPELKIGEILVKNLYTTICGSDLHTFCGLRHEKTPTVLGHEIVGRVVEIGESHSGQDYEGNSLRKGDVITWSIFSADPLSDLSLSGMPQKSAGIFKYGHGLVTDLDAFHGGLAEYCVLRADTAILKIPPGVPLPVAATINCAIATVSGALRLAGNVKDKTVLITGMGLLGMVCAAICKDAGALKVFASDINESRLEQSRLFGVDQTSLLHRSIDVDDVYIYPDLPSQVDVVFDMSGSADAMEAGIAALAVGGVAVWVGAVYPGRKVQLDAEHILRRLVTIKGLHNYNYDDFVYAVDFVKRCHQVFPFDTIVGKEFLLKDAEMAFEYALKHKPLRVGVIIEQN